MRLDGAGVEVTYLHASEMHRRHLRDDEFDLFEYSLAGYLVARERPAWAHLAWTALPVFLARPYFMFEMVVHEGAKIRSAGDLRGKRVGLPDFFMTMAVWLRIALRDLHGIQPGEIEWVSARPASARHSSDLGEGPLPAGLVVRDLPDGVAYEEAMRTGWLDAAIDVGGAARTIHAGGALRPLFAVDDAREVFRSFQRHYGGTPLNHVAVVRQRVLECDPALARSLYELFERAKTEAYARAKHASFGYLHFPDIAWRDQAADFGADPYPSGIAQNRALIEALAREMRDEGQLERVPDVAALFPPVLQDT